MLCAVPLLRALRTKFPSAYIALIASPVNYDVMLHLQYINTVVEFDKREFLGRGLRGIRALFQFIRNLRRENFDLAIVPSTVSVSFTSDLIARLSGARVRIGVSRLDGKETLSAFCFNVPVELAWGSSSTRHQTLRNFDIARPLGLSPPPLNLEITLNEDEKKVANELKNKKIQTGKRIVIYHPGAGKVPNRWAAERFAHVANVLAQTFAVSTQIIEGPMDAVPVSEMLRHLAAPFELITGKKIREVAAILSAADLVITNDTGIMHVAAGVGVPVLSLFGPTDPAQWAPIGRHHCFLRGKDGDINTVTADEVIRCAAEMLSKQHSG